MKTCRKCGEEKPFDCFSPHSSGKTKHLYRSYCKPCSSKVTAERRENDPEYKEAQMASRRKWGKENTRHLTQKVRERRQGLSNRTPVWLSEEHKSQMDNMYAHARDCHYVSGQEYHVDHIVPLCGENVSGLNVPWNLQVLPADINISKSNSYDNWS